MENKNKSSDKALSEPLQQCNVSRSSSEELDLELKQLQVLEKKAQIEKFEVDKIANEAEKTKVDKINTLRYLLESVTIDADKTILGSEPQFKNVFSEEEQWTIKDRIFKILRTF